LKTILENEISGKSYRGRPRKEYMGQIMGRSDKKLYWNFTVSRERNGSESAKKQSLDASLETCDDEARAMLLLVYQLCSPPEQESLKDLTSF
jgi:hypothetical protein